MKKPNAQKVLNGTARAAVADPNAAPGSVPAFMTVERKQDPRETAQEAVHQVTLRETIQGPFTPIDARDTVQAPLRAAKGDDELMSQPPKKPS